MLSIILRPPETGLKMRAHRAVGFAKLLIPFRRKGSFNGSGGFRGFRRLSLFETDDLHLSGPA